jgi:hypothetical protein
MGRPVARVPSRFATKNDAKRALLRELTRLGYRELRPQIIMRGHRGKDYDEERYAWSPRRGAVTTDPIARLVHKTASKIARVFTGKKR